MPEQKIAQEESVIAPTENNSTENNSSVAPTEKVENTQEAEIKEDIDPRIVEIIGEDKINEAYGEKPKVEIETTTDDKRDEKEDTKVENKVEEKKEFETPNIPPLEAKPTRLDRRLANRYIHVLHLTGEKNIPTEDEVIADLKNYSQEEKIQALKFHIKKGKELRGENPENSNLDEEDETAIRESQKEAIRQEILQEEHEKQYKEKFIAFVDAHPELVAGNKEYDPTLEKAVATLVSNGLPIEEAYSIVSGQIQAVKEEKIEQEKKEKTIALSGIVSGTGQVVQQEKTLSWEDVDRISKEDPATYRRMIAEGKFKHLM